jgi:NAD(P)-dependent dehydrogenase (short-subunit alcohol dehydrogenase family)
MNLFGTVDTVNAVAPIMKEQRSGKIITVSSVAGAAPSADGGYAHYGAAKAAIAHYTRYLAQDLGPFGITANCIAPGVIASGWIMAKTERRTTGLPSSLMESKTGVRIADQCYRKTLEFCHLQVLGCESLTRHQDRHCRCSGAARQ